MQLTSQLIERNLDLFADRSDLLVFGAPDAALAQSLPNAQWASFDYKSTSALVNQCGEERVQFGLPHDLAFGACLVFMPKAKDELGFIFAALLAQLPKDADVYLVGEKKGGINSAAKTLPQYGSNASKLDSAKHSQLWHFNFDQSISPFSLEDWFKEVDLNVADHTLRMAYLPGSFCHGRLDDGTALLLEHLPKRLRGRVLDFACGNGVIGLLAKLRFPDIELEQVDVSWLAIQCAKRSAKLNDIDTNVYPSDGWQAVRGRVDGVLTNPPFHEGVKTAYDTTERFIAESPGKLSKSAPFILVANNFLRYSPFIERALGKCDTLAENTRFRLYYAFR